MKKHLKIISLMFCASLILAGCSKDGEYAEKLPSSSELILPEFGVENGMLKFKSAEDWDAAIKAAALQIDINPDTKGFAGTDGFTSLYDLFDEAIFELDMVSSLAELAAFHDKYKDIFLFDNVDPENNCPYLPVSNSVVARLIDVNGNIMIGDEVVNCRNLNSYEDTFYYKAAQQPQGQMTKADPVVTSYTNYLYVFNGRGNKFWAEVGKDGNHIYVEITAQRKKALIGWNHYKENFYFVRGTYANGIQFTGLAGSAFQTSKSSAHTRVLIGLTPTVSQRGQTSYAIYTGEMGSTWARTLSIDI